MLNRFSKAMRRGRMQQNSDCFLKLAAGGDIELMLTFSAICLGERLLP
jgi:hypothetical protein